MCFHCLPFPTSKPSTSVTPSLLSSLKPYFLEIIITKNNLIDVNNNPPNEFILTFKLNLIGVISDWGNIMQFTATSNDCCYYGQRWLGFWFKILLIRHFQRNCVKIMRKITLDRNKECKLSALKISFFPIFELQNMRIKKLKFMY